ncbi:MAG: ABC transporter ATP-binding protein [Planctomycetaceae bacterium]
MTDSAAASSDQPVIRINSLTVNRGDRTICRAPDVAVSRGERLGVTGPNGSGKSTLLRVLAGFEKSFRGECHVGLPPAELIFVHQTVLLFRGTVLNNVEYGLKAGSVPRSVRRQLAQKWLDRFEIGHLADRSIQRLSGGEARRTALARACVLSPSLLLLDEPLADLDTAGIDCVRAAFAALPDSTIVIGSPTPLPAGFVERSIELSPA